MRLSVFESFFGDQSRGYTVSVISKKLKVLKLSQEDFLKIVREKQIDYDKFCEIRDKIQIESNFEDLNIFCKICSSNKHNETQCPVIFKNFNKKFQMQKLPFYTQEINKRVKCQKRKNNKERFVVLRKKMFDLPMSKESLQSFSVINDFNDGSDDETKTVLSNLNRITKTVDIDRINLNRKENYFPQNHSELVIFEYNQNLRRKFNAMKDLF